MKKVLSAICFIALIISATTVTLSAQKEAIINFSKTVHDYGTIVETDGVATCVFEFTNRGDQPLVINNVAPSCGCTAPNWTREPIAPGATGKVEAAYNPLGRVGPFDKTLTVITNGKPSNIILHIKGNVLPKPIDIKAVYPLNIGNLRLKKTEVPMGLILSDAVKTIVIETANAEDTPVSFSFEKIPSYLTINAEPSSLEPKQQGVIRFTYNAKDRSDFGFSKDQIIVKVGNQKGTIDVTALIKENLPVPAANSDLATQTPRIMVQNSTFDFGTAAKGKTATATYEISNEGKGDLIIRSISSDNAQVKSSVKNLKIKSGKKANIKLTLTATTQGASISKIYLSTNDPASTIFELNLKGTVN